MPKRYVVTGAPGAGKTMLLRALDQRGYAVVEEAATDVIVDAQARGVDEPWLGDGFLDDIVRLQRRRQQEPVPSGACCVQLFDRSALCTLALARYLRRPVTPLLAAEVDRVVGERTYQREVFLVRPLGFVQPTAARRISYPDSLRFERVHEQVYREHGFHLVEIPAAEVGARADLAQPCLGRWSHGSGWPPEPGTG